MVIYLLILLICFYFFIAYLLAGDLLNSDWDLSHSLVCNGPAYALSPYHDPTTPRRSCHVKVDSAVRLVGKCKIQEDATTICGAISGSIKTLLGNVTLTGSWLLLLLLLLLVVLLFSTPSATRITSPHNIAQQRAKGREIALPIWVQFTWQLSHSTESHLERDQRIDI